MDIKNKKFLIGILIIGLITASVLFVLFILGIIPLRSPGPPILGTVIISTDKTEYEQGELIRIRVKNSLGKSVWRHSECGGNLFWGLQKLENSKWKWLHFSLPYLEEEKEVCDFILCERAEPVEFKSGSELSYDWWLSICKWPESPVGVPKTEPKRIEEGTYRISFTYGLNKEGFDLLEEKTIYSDEFTVEDTSMRRPSLGECQTARVGCEAQVIKEEGSVKVGDVYKVFYEGISCEEWDRKCRWYVPGE